MTRIIFKKKFDDTLDCKHYLCCFPDDKVTNGTIGVIPFQLFTDGSTELEEYKEMDLTEYLRYDIVHSKSDEAKKLLEIMKTWLPEEELAVFEKRR